MNPTNPPAGSSIAPHLHDLADLVVENAADSIFVMDSEGRTLFANPAAERTFGWLKHELVGHVLHDMVHHHHPDGRPFPISECPLGQVFSSRRRLEQHEDVFFHRNGDPIHVACSNAPVIRDGQMVGAVLIAVDISERKRIETALLESEARFRNMADHAPVMIWVTDPTGSCTYLNQGWYAFTGQTREEAEGFGWLDATHPDDRAKAERLYIQANASRQPFRLEYRLRRHDGAYRWALDAASPRFGPGGEFLGYIGSVIDINERYEAEDRLRTLTNSLPAFVWFATPDGELHYFNDRWYEYTGQTREQALPNGWADTLHPEDAERTAEVWADARAREVTYEIEVRYRRRDGAYRWYVARAEPLRDASGAVAGWVGTSNDIHDRSEVRRRLRELNEKLESEVEARTAERNRVWEMSRDLFAIMGFDGHLKAINPAWEATLGISSAKLLSLPFPQQVHPDDHAAVREVMGQLLQGESVSRFEDRLRHADGSWRWISWTLVPEGEVFYAVGRDVTPEKEAAAELEAAQEALRQSQKMEAMGQLTRGRSARLQQPAHPHPRGARYAPAEGSGRRPRAAPDRRCASIRGPGQDAGSAPARLCPAPASAGNGGRFARPHARDG